ncbi:MAG: hypothetical protein AABY91_04845 [Gemmatimonadota bacterium]
MTHATPPRTEPWPGRHFVLVLIIILLVLTVTLIFRDLSAGHFRLTDPWSARYGNLVVGIMLLLNHLAFQYRRPGWKGKVLVAVALAWLTLGTVYIFYSWSLS